MSDPAPTPTPEPAPVVDPPPAPPAPPEYKPPASQADLDRIVQDRLSREKAKYADYDDVKAKAAKLDELEAQNKTELERAQAAQAVEKERADKAESLVQTTLKRAAVVAAASAAKAADPEDVYALMTQEQRDALIIGDDGRVMGAADAVKALLESKPHLVGQGQQGMGSAEGGPQGAAAPGQLSEADLKTMSPEEIVKAQDEGRLNNLLGVKS